MCPAGSPGGTCGTLYAGLGYVDQCDKAYLVFGVAPNTQILSLAQAADPYTFYVGQTITVYIPKSQPYILQDELIRITVGAQSNTAITSTGGGGGSLGGLNYTSNNGISIYTIGNSWGTGSGIQLYAAPGGNTVGKGIAPACSGNGCSPGTTSQTTTVSGMISTIMNYSSPVPPTGPPTSVTSIPNNGITILPTSLFVEDTYDAVAATYASAGPVTVNNQVVWVSFMTAGATGLATPALALYYNATSCGFGCGGSTVQVTVNGKVYQRYFTTTYTSSRTKVGDNTFANGGALNYTLPSTLFTTIPGCTSGGCTGVGYPAGNNLMWIWDVTAGGVTNYSSPFRLFVPPPPSATPSTTPSNGASQSPTPSQTGTPALSRGATASTTPSGSLSQTPSPSPTRSVTPTVSDTSRPAFSPAPNLFAFNVSSPPRISNLAPSILGVSPGFLQLTIEGLHFCENVTCGTLMVNGDPSFSVPQSWSDTKIVVVLQNRPATVQVTVYGNSAAYSSNVASFSGPAPAISSLAAQVPVVGQSTTGGSPFSISGVVSLATVLASNVSILFGPFACLGLSMVLDGNLAMQFNVSTVSPIYSQYDTYRLDCVTPPGVGANLPVLVSSVGVGTSAANGNFTFSYAAPIISSVRDASGASPLSYGYTAATGPSAAGLPTVGTAAGALALAGQNLGTEALIQQLCLYRLSATVCAGGTPLFGLHAIDMGAGRIASCSVLSHTQTGIVFAMPPGQGANIQLAVNVGEMTAAAMGSASQQAVLVRYLSPVVAAAFNPVTGQQGDPTAGGTQLTIAGSNFGQGGAGSASAAQGLPVVTIGGRAASVVSATQNSITVVLPAGSGVAQPVIVSVEGQASSSTVMYSYSGAPATSPAPLVITFSITFAGLPLATAQRCGAALLAAVGAAIADMIGVPNSTVAISLAASSRRLQPSSASATATSVAGVVSAPASALSALQSALFNAMASPAVSSALSARVAVVAGLPAGSITSSLLAIAIVAAPQAAAGAGPASSAGSGSSLSPGVLGAIVAVLAAALLAGGGFFMHRRRQREEKTRAPLVLGSPRSRQRSLAPELNVRNPLVVVARSSGTARPRTARAPAKAAKKRVNETEADGEENDDDSN